METRYVIVAHVRRDVLLKRTPAGQWQRFDTDRLDWTDIDDVTETAATDPFYTDVSPATAARFRARAREGAHA